MLTRSSLTAEKTVSPGYGTFSFASLRARLLLLILLALAPVLLSTLIIATIRRQEAHRQAEADLLRQVLLMSNAQRQMIEATRRLLALIATLTSVESALTGGDPTACADQLLELNALYPDYLGFGVWGTGGDRICTQQMSTPGINIADRLWFQEALASREFAIGAFQISRPLGIPALGFGYPILNNDGEPVAVVSALLNLETLLTFSPDIVLPAEAVITVQDREGIILARQPDFETWSGQPGENVPSMPITQTQSSGVIVETIGVDGVGRVYAFVPVLGPSHTNAYLSLGLPSQQLYGPADAEATRTTITVVVVVLVALGMLWISSQRFILRPIERLADVTARLGQGDLAVRIPARMGSRELDRLALKFNSMAEALEQREASQQTAEAKLRANEAYLVTILEQLPVGVGVMDLNGRWVVSNALMQMYVPGMIPSRDPQRMAYWRMFDAGGQPVTPDNWPGSRALRGETVIPGFDCLYTSPTAEDRWLHVSATPLWDERESVAAAIAVVMDIDKQKRVELALRESEERLHQLNESLEQRVAERTAALTESERQIRQMASLLTMAEHEERRRISQLLHDDLQQQLVAIKINLSLVRQDITAGNAAAILMWVNETEQWITQSIEMTRQLTLNLSPSILKSEGLVDALEWLAAQMKRAYDLNVLLVAEHAFPMPNEELRILLFQIIRELLFNVVKHAGTNRAMIRLHNTKGYLVIHVRDEGCGFDMSEAQQVERAGSFGLLSVRERLGFISGRVEIESAPGAGTHVTLYVPIINP